MNQIQPLGTTTSLCEIDGIEGHIEQHYKGGNNVMCSIQKVGNSSGQITWFLQ